MARLSVNAATRSTSTRAGGPALDLKRALEPALVLARDEIRRRLAGLPGVELGETDNRCSVGLWYLNATVELSSTATDAAVVAAEPKRTALSAPVKVLAATLSPTPTPTPTPAAGAGGGNFAASAAAPECLRPIGCWRVTMGPGANAARSSPPRSKCPPWSTTLGSSLAVHSPPLSLKRAWDPRVESMPDIDTLISSCKALACATTAPGAEVSSPDDVPASGPEFDAGASAVDPLAAGDEDEDLSHRQRETNQDA